MYSTLIIFFAFVIILTLFQEYRLEGYESEYYPVRCYRDELACHPAVMRERPTSYHGPGLLPYRYNLAPLVKGLPEARQPWVPVDRNRGEGWLPEWSQRRVGKKWLDYRLPMPKSIRDQ